MVQIDPITHLYYSTNIHAQNLYHLIKYKPNITQKKGGGGEEEGKEKNSKPISFNQIQTKYYKN